MLTQADILAALTQLRDTGHAVIVWTPDELRNCPIDDLQDRSIERGWEIIEYFNDDDEEE